MNFPQVSPPPRLKEGTPSSITPMQAIEIWSWHKAVEALGTVKTKAREMGLSPDAIHDFIQSRRRWERGDRS